MNELANEADSAQRWRYGLANGCTLEVQATSPEEKRMRLVIPLEGAQVARHFDDEKRDYNVSLIQATGSAKKRTTIFSNGERIDSLRMQSLVNSLLADCQKSSVLTLTTSSAPSRTG